MRRVSHFFTEEKHRTQSRIFTHGSSPCSVKARIKSYELSSYSIHFFPFSLVSADHVFRTTSDFYSFPLNLPLAHCQTFTRFRQTRLSRIVRLLLVCAKPAFHALSDFHSFRPNPPLHARQTFTRFRQTRLSRIVRLLLVSAKCGSAHSVRLLLFSKKQK